ncbi:MAG: hypothetical protein LC124_13555 [Ignavibacteriales bacterium]|jgi:hypothetical protein|nr:hypothetical protein [Ignavibacterium sp.]MCZ2269870.1 hypothetical protein [Ignavibacteriales bacterium]MDD5608988.1 hypothetical protein [Ignavibacterium sp.]MDX9711519.1 hypothetical protein [Ignavibacteriaceae bacterium]
MTQEEFDNAVTYLSNPGRNTLIEAELPNSSQIRFENLYANLTNNHPLPAMITEAPYYVWTPGTNKWGVELRLYFISDRNIPEALEELSVNNSRHGYEQYDKRINNNDFIYDLFTRGFVIGEQITGRIQ